MFFGVELRKLSKKLNIYQAGREPVPGRLIYIFPVILR